MKSVIYGILIACPITALVIFFALSGRQDVIIQQKNHEIQQQIRSEEFHRDFSKAWNEFDSNNTQLQVNSEPENTERAARIKQLKQLRSQLEAEENQSMENLGTDLTEMRKALKEADSGQKKILQ